VKPYGCHFGCFKVPETPVLDDENAKKKPLNILFSLFLLLLLLRLQKEKLKGRQGKTRAHLLLITLRLGNYRTLNAELFVNQGSIIMIM
jgi:hypothetical protein